MKEKFLSLKKYIPTHSIVFLAIFIISLIVKIFANISQGFASGVTASVGFAIRRLLAFISDIFPFSIAEIIIIASPFIIVMIVLSCVRAFSDKALAIRKFISVISLLSLIYSSYIFTLGVGYKRVKIEEEMNLTSTDVNSKTLYETLLYLKEGIEENAEYISLTLRW